jgi:dTDP-4-amino-4,6-dideoxygalactose transaminase
VERPEIKHELEISHGNIYGLEEAQALLQVLQAGAPSCGLKVKQFEEAFAAYCGVRYALTVTSATTGLILAGIAAGVGPGTEVVTTPLSWIATASAFSVLGADLVFCDVDPRTLNLDPDVLKGKITKKTRAIVPVHLAGQCCAMDRIMHVAQRHGVPVIEDCAHNPGGEYLGRKSGALGAMGVFSFHQQKNMCTLGEGGMVTTDSRELYEKVLSYRSLCCRIHGGSYKYLPIDEARHPMGNEYWRLQFDDFGYNFRMTDAQAAVGLEQLKKLDGFNARRIELAASLTRKLEPISSIVLPYEDPQGKHVYHFYVIQLKEGHPLTKAQMMWELYTKKGIKAWNHYMPIHLSEPYRRQGHREGECPVAEKAHDYFLSLPIHPRLDETAIEYMADCIAELSEPARE